MLQDSLPTFSSLSHRGIPVTTTCPLCNEDDETSTHLFLLCSFARACWHGSTLAIHASDFHNTSIQQCLSLILSKHNLKDEVSMEYLQKLFTVLWTILNHRNKVVHEGTSPNSMQIILTAQSLSCRYKNSFFAQSSPNWVPRPDVEPQSTAGPWQLIIKVVGFRNKRKKRCAYVYEAVNPQGECVCFGVSNSLARTALGVMLEAVVEGCFTAINHGLQ